MRRLFALLLTLMLLIPAGCAEGKISVVCTNFPCYDILRQLTGDVGEVTMLLKPGTEAHAYDPTPQDILTIGSADLFVLIGGESDAWADNLLSGLDEAPETLRMMDAVADPVPEEGHLGHQMEYDEHIWLSPKNALAMVAAAEESLSAIDPNRAEIYAANAASLSEQIKAIDDEIRAIVDQAPRRELVFGDRFPFVYLTKEYGLEYLAAFPSCTAETEPSAQVVMSLIQKIVEDHLPAVYTIELSNQAIAKTIAEETGVDILTLHSMQTVTQSEFEAGESWVSIMSKNVEALRRGLN